AGRLVSVLQAHSRSGGAVAKAPLVRSDAAIGVVRPRTVKTDDQGRIAAGRGGADGGSRRLVSDRSRGADVDTATGAQSAVIGHAEGGGKGAGGGVGMRDKGATASGAVAKSPGVGADRPVRVRRLSAIELHGQRGETGE